MKFSFQVNFSASLRIVERAFIKTKRWLQVGARVYRAKRW